MKIVVHEEVEGEEEEVMDLGLVLRLKKEAREKEEEGDDEIVAGIDEVARGSIAGSMFVCLYAISRGKERTLLREKYRVRDSKEYRTAAERARRTRLSEQLREAADECVVVEATAEQISSRPGELNEITYELFKTALMTVRKKHWPTTVYVDACSNPEELRKRFVRDLSEDVVARSGLRLPEFVVSHGADAKYPVVSAASIVAKERREDWVREVAHLGIGSGYPGDAKTMAWVKKTYAELGVFHPLVRTCWKTCDQVVASLTHPEDLPQKQEQAASKGTKRVYEAPSDAPRGKKHRPTPKKEGEREDGLEIVVKRESKTHVNFF